MDRGRDLSVIGRALSHCATVRLRLAILDRRCRDAGTGDQVADLHGSEATFGDITPAVLAALEPGEEIVDLLPGLGASLVVTSARVMVIREGTHFRPRNGIRSWPHGELRDVSLALPRRGHGRIVLREGRDPKQAVSVFIEADSWSAAERIVGDIHARARASHKAAEADDPPGARSH